MAVIPYPFNKEIEIELLAIMLNHQRMVPYINKKVTHKMFYLQDHQRLFRALNYCYNTIGIKLDPLVLSEQYKKMYTDGNDISIAVVSEIIQGGLDDSRTDWLVEKIHEYASRRKLIKMSQYTQKYANDLSFDLIELMVGLQSGIDLINVTVKSESNLSDDLDAMVDSLGKTNAVVPFGKEVLDRKAGGLLRSDITTLGGRTGHGKTTFLIDTVISQLNLGYKIDVVTNEVKKQLYLQKMVCNIAKVEYNRVIKFGDITDEEMVRLKDAYKYM